MRFVLIAAAALAAGLVQGIAGFGSGPVQMLVYPALWALPTAAAVSVCVSVPLNAHMVWTYRGEINWKNVLWPALPYMAVCFTAIHFAPLADPALMKRVFGGFLILLAAWHFIFSRREQPPLTRPLTALYIFISALCDAFFGIGGPLMVLFFLHRTRSGREYLGTVAAFFLLNGIANTLYRVFAGILTPAQLPAVGVGIAAILAGSLAARRLVGRMNDARLRAITYGMIGLCGLINLLG